uniref:G-protein coupled receptors family 1 profile domain-containing protein n=1 Tax=Petromyzon marinus TaxID=7757 RepID=S4RLN1_PETMA
REGLMLPPGMILMTGLLREPANTRPLVFAFIFLMYALSVLGSLCLTLAIAREAQLRKPMYVFLCGLALNGVVMTTATQPRILYDLVSVNVISFAGCVAQMSVLHFATIVSLLNGVVAAKLCMLLMALAALFVSGEVILGSVVKLCTKPRVVSMPSCDFMSLTKMSCEDTSANVAYGYFLIAVPAVGSLGIIVLSYVGILYECKRSSRRGGQHKAIRTCVTHFCVLCISYVFVIFMVLQHRISNSNAIPITARSILSSLYYIFPPALNPIIYGLRTSEIRQSLSKLLHHKSCLDTE